MEDIKADIEIIRVCAVVDFAHYLTRWLFQDDAVLEIAKEQMRRRTFHPASTPVRQPILGICVKEAEGYNQRGRVINQPIHC